MFTKPDKGYVVEYNELERKLRTILLKLGLNIKETSQFVDYWTHALPKSAYYFIGIVPTSQLSSYSSLNINPKPTSEIRVTLYFKPLTEKISVKEPEIITPLRSGFTVVEWGGIYKKHANESFSCIM